MQLSETSCQAFDVSVLQGSAVTLRQHPLGFAAGEKHDVIVFMRKPHGDETDLLAIDTLMREAGWRKSLLSLIFVLSDQSRVLNGDTILDGSYRAALEYGGSIIVCDEAD